MQNGASNGNSAETCPSVSVLTVVHMTNGARYNGNPIDSFNTFGEDHQSTSGPGRKTVGPIEVLTHSNGSAGMRGKQRSCVAHIWTAEGWSNRNQSTSLITH